MTQRASATYSPARQVPLPRGRWVETWARFGYATKGILYLLIGLLATQVAIGAGGSLQDSQGAIETIAQQPFGSILLGLVALGLAGYTLWSFVQAFADPEHEGTDARGIAIRIGRTISGIVHGGLAFLAARIALGRPHSGAGGAGGDGAAQEWTATLLTQPFGQWLVGIIGVIVIGVGLAHFYLAYKASFMEKYTGEMSPKQRRWAKRIGQFGLCARGVTFGLIGSFLIQAAFQTDPSQTRGLSGALQTLATQPQGPWLLGIVALGLVAYSLYCFSQARYRRVQTG